MEIVKDEALSLNPQICKPNEPGKKDDFRSIFLKLCHMHHRCIIILFLMFLLLLQQILPKLIHPEVLPMLQDLLRNSTWFRKEANEALNE